VAVDRDGRRRLEAVVSGEHDGVGAVGAYRVDFVAVARDEEGVAAAGEG
jgi:hypothetical protein